MSGDVAPGKTPVVAVKLTDGIMVDRQRLYVRAIECMQIPAKGALFGGFPPETLPDEKRIYAPVTFREMRQQRTAIQTATDECTNSVGARAWRVGQVLLPCRMAARFCSHSSRSFWMERRK